MKYRSMLLCVVFFVVGAAGIAAQDDSDYAKWLRLTRSAPAAYVAGDKKIAAAEANELLSMAAAYRRDWNYGNAVHAAHLVLGRIAADAGQMAEARRRLIESVTTLPYAFGPEITKTQPWEEPFPKLAWKASPQRDSFGPDMSLARFMLEKGDKETVLKYLDHCDKFWTLGGDKLALWRKQINADEMPDFGSNLGYVFPRIKSNDH